MNFILKNLPYGKGIRPEYVPFAGRRHRIKEHQILIWVSIGLPSSDQPTPKSHIPAILDTGLTHNFAIYEGHLKFLGVPSSFPKLSAAKLAERPNETEGKVIRMPKIDANLWVWRNIPGTRDIDQNAEPHLFELEGGVIVHTDKSPVAPRLPTFGLKALSDADLALSIDGKRQRVSMFTKSWLRRIFDCVCS